VAKDGTVLWMEAHVAVTTDAEGRTSGLRGVVNDISKRKHAELAYEESQRLIRRIAETMPSMLYLYDFTENRNLFCNRRIRYVLGYSEEEVQEMGPDLLKRLVHPDDADSVFAHTRKLIDLADEEVLELEYRLRSRNGEYRWLYGRETVFTRDTDGKPRSILGVAHDVTERRRDQLALKRSEELNRAVIDSLTSLIVIVDHKGKVLAANRAWQRRWAATRRGGAAPMDIGDGLLQPAGVTTNNVGDSPQALREGLEKVLDGSLTDFRMEYAVNGSDGASWFELSVLALRRREGGAVICHTDITARKRAEEELQKSHEQVRELAGRLISAQEEERRRIAQELHDDLSQRLAAQAISLSNLQRDFDAGATEVVEAGIEKLRKSAVSIADDVRAISHELHPPVLMFAGLTACLESLCREFSATNGLRVAFRVESDPGRVSSDAALCLYRAAQEALRNVCKHAHASAATVTLSKGPKGVVMRIEDDGVGVAPGGGTQRRGLGLISLRERAHLLRGSFSVTPRSAGGTCLEVGIPGD
jgi:PAS domain S-box-containing protein